MPAKDWTFGLNQSLYTTVSGTQPTPDKEHEPRMVKREKNEGLVQMMSEIGDGIFVAWSNCARCHDWVGLCQCENGPVEPDYIGRWRDERFQPSVQSRLSPSDSEPSERRLRPARSVPSAAPSTPSKVDSALDSALAAVQEAQ